MNRLSPIHWLGVVVGALSLALLMLNDNGPFPIFKPRLVEAPVAPPGAANHVSERNAAGPAAPADLIRPRTEDIVVFRNSSIVCLTMDDLHRALISGAGGETTKLRAMMMDSSNPNAPCWMIDPTRRVKVLSATYQPEAIAGLLEIVGEHTKSAHGAWVLSLGAEIVVPAPRETK